jgi:hypothetical protein
VIALLIAAYVAAVIWAVVTGHVGLLITVTVAVIGGGYLAKRMYAAGKVRRKQIQAAEGRTRWPRALRTSLKDDENVIHETRMHPVVIFYSKWVAIFACAFVATFIAGLLWTSTLLLLTVGSLLGLCVSTAPRAINWWFTRRCYTDLRVIVITGIFTKHVDAIMLRHLETVSHEVPFVSSVLEYIGLAGVWHWKFDTQVQQDPFNDLRWSTYPSPVGDILEQYEVPDDSPS